MTLSSGRFFSAASSNFFVTHRGFSILKRFNMNPVIYWNKIRIFVKNKILVVNIDFAIV